MLRTCVLVFALQASLACSDGAAPRSRTNVSSGSGGSAGASGASSSGGSAGSGAGSAGASAGTTSTGGSAGSAGSAGTNSTGGSAGSAGSGGSAGGAAPPLFFDDFEAASVDSAKWTERVISGGTIALDTAQFHAGAKALHVTVGGFSTLLANEGTPIFPAPNNTFYGRVWLYVPGPLPTGHVVWIEAGDVTNDTHEVRIGMNLGYFQANLYYQGEVDIRAPTAPLMADTWQCVEFKMGNDELEVWLNGTRVDDLSTTNWVAANSENGNTVPKSNWSPTYAALRIGWELGSGQIYFDDVALDHQKIGCN